MSLSNTATPKYYSKFRDDVVMGRIPVCKTVAMEMKRIDQLIKNPGVYYDLEAVENWINFCEGELTLTDGSKLFLLDSFKLWGEAVHGWYYIADKSIYSEKRKKFVKRRVVKRLCNKQYLIVGRGASKTLYAECNQAYGLVIDQDTTHGVTVAPTMHQAEEVLLPFKTAISRAPGPMFQFLTEGTVLNTTGPTATRQKLAATKKGIENFMTNSLLEIRPMSIDKLQGLQNKYSTVDEWLSGDIREDVIGALEQGASKVEDWLIIATSSEGTVRNGPGDDIKLELMEILKGNYYAPHVSIWWYKLDDVKEVRRPDLWVKANPNLGQTVDYETYRKEVERAEKVPSTRNDTLAKRFGIPTEGYTYFFTYDETLPHKHREFWQMPCSMGIDLSQGDDFCAFTFLFPLSRGEFGIKTRSYVSSRTMGLLQPSMYQEYQKFLKEGSLVVLDGTVLDMMEVYDDLDSHIESQQYDVRTVGFDPYNAKAFIERWATENGDYGIEKVPQGVKTESVPLGEIKKMATDRVLLFDEELMKFAMGNCVVLEDTNGNRKLYKKRSEEKIDNVSALLDALVAYKRYPELFE